MKLIGWVMLLLPLLFTGLIYSEGGLLGVMMYILYLLVALASVTGLLITGHLKWR